jgi:hypothetical protein
MSCRLHTGRPPGLQYRPLKLTVPKEPAEQQVVIELLHQLALRAHRVEGLEQQRPQQLLRRNEGRPILEYSPSKAGDMTSSASSTMALIGHTGWFAGTRASQLT